MAKKRESLTYWDKGWCLRGVFREDVTTGHGVEAPSLERGGRQQMTRWPAPLQQRTDFKDQTASVL